MVGPEGSNVPFLAWVRYPGSDYATPVRDPDMLDKFLETGYRLVERADASADHRGAVQVYGEVDWEYDTDPAEVVAELMRKVVDDEKQAAFVTQRLIHELVRAGYGIFGLDDGVPHCAVFTHAGFVIFDPRDFPSDRLTTWDGEKLRQLVRLDGADGLWQEVDEIVHVERLEGEPSD